MRSKGNSGELFRRRVLAVRRWLEGYSAAEIAEFLDVDRSSVWRWVQAFLDRGEEGLCVRSSPGRPRKLSSTQEKIALKWLLDKPSQHGFDTELWTARRLAELMCEEWGISLNARYVSRWLAARGFSPQRPQRVPRERNAQVIADWLQQQWSRIKKKPSENADGSFSSTKAAF